MDVPSVLQPYAITFLVKSLCRLNQKKMGLMPIPQLTQFKSGEQ